MVAHGCPAIGPQLEDDRAVMLWWQEPARSLPCGGFFCGFSSGVPHPKERHSLDIYCTSMHDALQICL